MPSPEYHQDHRHKSSQESSSPNRGSQSLTSMVRPDRTWAEAARSLPGQNTDLAVKLPTYHVVAKDYAVPCPFAANPHLLINGRCSRSSDYENELIFIHVYSVGQTATKEMLQRYRTEAHIVIRKRIGVNLFYTDALGDTLTVVTRKSDKHQGDWILTSDIDVRFPSKRSACIAYEQQRNQ